MIFQLIKWQRSDWWSSTACPRTCSLGPYTWRSILAFHTSQRMRVIKHQHKVTKISYTAVEARHLKFCTLSCGVIINIIDSMTPIAPDIVNSSSKLDHWHNPGGWLMGMVECAMSKNMQQVILLDLVSQAWVWHCSHNVPGWSRSQAAIG